MKLKIFAVLAVATVVGASASLACGGSDDDSAEPSATAATDSDTSTSLTPRATKPSDIDYDTPVTAPTAFFPSPTVSAPSAPPPAAAEPTNPPPAAAVPTATVAPPPPPPPPPPPANTTLNLGATGVRYSTASLNAPAGIVTISFSNNDDGISHNVHVFAGASTEPGASVGATALAAGPVQQTLNLGTLVAGDYSYRCDVHPSTMSGKLTVTP